MCKVYSGLTHYYQSLARKNHVRRRRPDEEFAQERAGGIPHLYAIATSCVDVSLGVNLDTVCDTRVGVGKNTAIGEGLACWVNIEFVSVR